MIKQAEYIWLDGNKPTQTLRSKTRIIDIEQNQVSLSDFPDWGFDGSSTGQATGDNSDCALKAVSFVADPIRGNGHFLVMCEVFEANGQEHPSNTRAKLRKVLNNGANYIGAAFGFEQEYTLFKDGTPLGWPQNGYPAPQGPYYCGVGGDRIFGRDIVEKHTQACINAGLLIFGTNAEVMAGQWEYQIGYRGFKNETADALTASDHMWFAAWLLHRICEDYAVTASFENKPVGGDWNGAGCHTNFSTDAMRNKETGLESVSHAITQLSKSHQDHMRLYGDGNDLRLTGDHETCSINEFRAGESDRGASIRIPMQTAQQGYGYLEDRRPGANSDPYVICTCILSTICILENPYVVKEKILIEV